MRWMLVIALMLCCMTAFAARSFRFSKGVVEIGDTTAALFERAGKPDHIAPLQNGFGAALGERWEYFLPGGKMVSFDIIDNRVTDIDDGYGH